MSQPVTLRHDVIFLLCDAGVKSEPRWDESEYGGTEDTPAREQHTPATYELKDSMSLQNVQIDEVPSLMTQVQYNLL